MGDSAGLAAKGSERAGPNPSFFSARPRPDRWGTLAALDFDACGWRLVLGANRDARAGVGVGANQWRCLVQTVAACGRVAARFVSVSAGRTTTAAGARGLARPVPGPRH